MVKTFRSVSTSSPKLKKEVESLGQKQRTLYPCSLGSKLQSSLFVTGASPLEAFAGIVAFLNDSSGIYENLAISDQYYEVSFSYTVYEVDKAVIQAEMAMYAKQDALYVVEIYTQGGSML